MTAKILMATCTRVASFLVLIPLVLTAAPVKKSRENFSEIIQKAQNLVLQKNRPQALEVLSAGLKNEKPNSAAFKELKKNLNEMSRMFISEKAQQAYEFSLSLKRADPPQAFVKINDALRAEPENFTFLLEAARQNLMKGDCKAALDLGQTVQKINFWDDELNLVLAQTKICLNDLVGYATMREAAQVANSVSWLSLEIERDLKEKNLMKAKEALSQLRKIDKKYPEQHYWAWKIDTEQKVNNLASAQDYKTECQNMTVAFYRRFALDPRLCTRVPEVEAFIKSQTQNP